MRLTLRPHPDFPAPAVGTITVDVARSGGNLSLTYAVVGRIAELAIPEPASADRADNLWQRTCCEAFVLPAGADSYLEFNLSPSTRWAAYGFDRYREGMADLEGIVDPVISFSATQSSLALAASVSLPATAAGVSWRLGLSCVIEQADGAKSFWALAHPSPAPDFHNAAGFTQDLP